MPALNQRIYEFFHNYIDRGVCFVMGSVSLLALILLIPLVIFPVKPNPDLKYECVRCVDEQFIQCKYPCQMIEILSNQTAEPQAFYYDCGPNPSLRWSPSRYFLHFDDMVMDGIYRYGGAFMRMHSYPNGTNISMLRDGPLLDGVQWKYVIGAVVFDAVLLALYLYVKIFFHSIEEAERAVTTKAAIFLSKLKAGKEENMKIVSNEHNPVVDI
ncbi:unnamed protein product [Caenorhabditis bovis]|uniref:Uncharacterized protein n=1 Tax=Caenorhabditis bovis TaxID=2654633 RepID=A0A8S1EFU2_9PELO|nr:unnamed protein product [Caenorhabditis bovis]